MCTRRGSTFCLCWLRQFVVWRSKKCACFALVLLWWPLSYLEMLLPNFTSCSCCSSNSKASQRRADKKSGSTCWPRLVCLQKNRPALWALKSLASGSLTWWAKLASASSTKSAKWNKLNFRLQANKKDWSSSTMCSRASKTPSSESRVSPPCTT